MTRTLLRDKLSALALVIALASAVLFKGGGENNLAALALGCVAIALSVWLWSMRSGLSVREVAPLKALGGKRDAIRGSHVRSAGTYMEIMKR